jgi:putative Holliday junction resolvase
MSDVTIEHSTNPPRAGLPAHGRLLGIDYGSVRIGIAICDIEQRIASPHDMYSLCTPERDADFFRQTVMDLCAVGIVVGLPLHLSGDENPKTVEARKFGSWLAEITGLPIVWHDERFSTAIARELLNESPLSPKKRKARVDQLAAQAILASFIESNRTNQLPPPLD